MTLDSRNAELESKLKTADLPKAVDTLLSDARRRRFQLRVLAVSIALDFILTIGLTFLSFKTSDLAQLAQNNRDAVIQNCETANDSRENQRALWGYVFSVSPTTPRTPEQEQQINEFRDFVNKTFAQRDCQAEANKSVD